MDWNDKAIILSVKKHGESSLVVKVISENNGIYSGFIKGATRNSKKQGSYQAGNIVQANWRAKTADSLGFFNVELLESTWTYLMNKPIKLNLMLSALLLLEDNFPEREENPEVFITLEEWLGVLKNEEDFLAKYILFEVEILSLLGYEFDLSECAVSGETDNLRFVSPKSGRAVSEEAGLPYKDKLLILPDFIVSGDTERVPDADLLDGLKLTGYFLDKYLYQPRGRKLPIARQGLLNNFTKKL